MNCKFCNKENDEDANYCIHCGKRISESTEPMPATQGISQFHIQSSDPPQGEADK